MLQESLTVRLGDAAELGPGPGAQEGLHRHLRRQRGSRGIEQLDRYLRRVARRSRGPSVPPSALSSAAELLEVKLMHVKHFKSLSEQNSSRIG